MRKLDNVKVAKELLKIADMVEAYRDTDPIMDVVKDKKFDIQIN